MSSKTTIFLSHSSGDKELAIELAQQIEREFAGMERVFASSRPDAIPSGTTWLEEVLNNLDCAEVMIILLTKQSENSVWVGFELGYFWKKANKKDIHVLNHPKAVIPNPLNTFQAKLINDVAQVQDFFTELCKHFGQPFKSQGDIEAITRKAETIVIPSELDRILAYQMRDALSEMRIPLDCYCMKAAPEIHYSILRKILESSPPDVGGPPGRPDETILIPVLNALQNMLLVEDCEGIATPKSTRWIDWILTGFENCREQCQTILNRHSATGDPALIAGLERLSNSITKRQQIFRLMSQHNIDKLVGSVGVDYFKYALQEMLHAERVWREVIGADVTK